jgi:hypothetical protein
MTENNSDLSVYARQVAKAELKEEFKNLNLNAVGMELIQGKTTSLENAFENANGRVIKKVCGEGALQELRPYYKYGVAGGLLLVGYLLYNKSK